MADTNAPILAFNRGRISQDALARVDIQRMAFSADVQTNLPPRVLGSMQLRPGWEHLFSSAGDARAKYLPFIFSTTDTALIEITATGIRIAVNDIIVTRVSVSTSIANGAFTTDLTSWTDNDETGAVSAFLTGGFLELVGTLFNAAIRRQKITVVAADINVEHSVRFVIERGPVSIKIGSSSGGAEYISEKELGTGTYSFVFTPTSDFHIELAGRAQAKSLVDSVEVDSSGDFTLPVPWATVDHDNIRFDQSADVLFIACKGFQQRRLDRFDKTSKSWGISLYEPNDGPFRGINITTTTLTPSALTGDITLTASRVVFFETHVGALFSILSTGQVVTASLTAQDQFTDDNSMRIIGVGSTRDLLIKITGTWVATITLQRSISDPGAWTDTETTFTANQDPAVAFKDDLDNQIIYYRIGIKTGDFTSGTAVVTLENKSGGIRGVVRVTAYTSAISVSAAVLSNLGGTDASRDWQEGSWSPFRGFPSAVAFYEGRLWWAGKARFIGSISDAFDLFDEDFEGDAGPINRSIGSGPVDDILWLLPIQRLIAGAVGSEISLRSTSFDEPLTPSNFNLKTGSTQGSAAVAAVKVDQNGIFVQLGKARVYELTVSPSSLSGDYSPTDLTDIIPEIGKPGIVRMAIQRQPDTRLHCVRSNGTVAMVVREPDNQVLAWLDIETNGLIEDVVILPGTDGDSGNSVASFGVVNGTENASVNCITSIKIDGVEALVDPVCFITDNESTASLIVTAINDGPLGENKATINCGWDLSTAAFVNESNITFGSFLRGGELSPDGKYVFIGDSVTREISRYPLSTNWDITTLSVRDQFIDLGIAGGPFGESTVPQGFVFKPDGLELYVNVASAFTEQYTLSQPFDLTSATFKFQYSHASDINPSKDVFFKPDGTRFYAIMHFKAGGPKIGQFDMSVPWSLETAMFVSEYTIVEGGLGNRWVAVSFKTEDCSDPGTKMYAMSIGFGVTDVVIYQYTLSTAWDVTTATYDSVSLNVDAKDDDSTGLFFGDQGTRMYFSGRENGKIYQYGLDVSVVETTTSQSPFILASTNRTSPSIIDISCLPDTGFAPAGCNGLAVVIATTGDIQVDPNPTVFQFGFDATASEESVYYHVKRIINGVTKRYLEKWAREIETIGGTLNKQADSFIVFTNDPPSATVTGLAHLEAELVVVWADGRCLRTTSGAIATFKVSASGTITLTNDGVPYIAATGIVGLAYQGRFKSTKLAYASQLGTALTQLKRLSHLGLLATNMHAQGLKYGPDFDNLDDLPLIDNEGTEVKPDTIHATYDLPMFEWPGGWGPDQRMCLEMNAPRPATVLGVVVGLKETDKT